MFSGFRKPDIGVLRKIIMNHDEKLWFFVIIRQEVKTVAFLFNLSFGELKKLYISCNLFILGYNLELSTL